MFSPVAGFHVSGRFCLSLTPDASRPRNDGQSPEPAVGGRSGDFAAPAVLTMRRAGVAATAPGGSQRLWSRIIRLAWHSSATSAKPTLDPSTLIAYLAAPSHFDGPGVFCSV